MGLFRDMLNEARNTSVPTEYRIALGQLKRMYNKGEVPSEKELQKDAEMIAKKNHIEEDKFFEFVKSQFKINEDIKDLISFADKNGYGIGQDGKNGFYITKADGSKHRYLGTTKEKEAFDILKDVINKKINFESLKIMNEAKKEFDKDATPEDKANAIMKRCKAFRADSTVGYLLNDADIIQGITDATKWSFRDSEKYFKDNYKSIKMNEAKITKSDSGEFTLKDGIIQITKKELNKIHKDYKSDKTLLTMINGRTVSVPFVITEAKSKEDLVKYYEKNLKNVEKEYSTDSRKQEYIDYAKGQLAAVKKDGNAGLIKFLKDWNMNEAAVGQKGRTSYKEAMDYCEENEELVDEFRKIIKKLGGKTVAKALLDKLSQKPEIKDEIEHIEDIIDNSNY